MNGSLDLAVLMHWSTCTKSGNFFVSFALEDGEAIPKRHGFGMKTKTLYRVHIDGIERCVTPSGDFKCS